MNRDIKELERWWNQFHGLPAPKYAMATMEDMEELAEEADQNVPYEDIQPLRWWSSGMAKVFLAILALMAVQVFLLWPRIIRLFQ